MPAHSKRGQKACRASNKSQQEWNEQQSYGIGSRDPIISLDSTRSAGNEMPSPQASPTTAAINLKN